MVSPSRVSAMEETLRSRLGQAAPVPRKVSFSMGRK
jgi:hypothetical protein